MKTGDIIFTYKKVRSKNKEPPHSLIKLGQNLNKCLAGGSDSTPLTHAAIAVNDTQVVEAGADGIVLSHLGEESNPRDAFVLRLRCFQPYFPNGRAVAYTLAALAGTQAMSYYMQGDNDDIGHGYRTPGAVASSIAGAVNGQLHSRLQQYSNYGDHSFAAGLVVNCYEIANLQGLWMDDKPPPAVFCQAPGAVTPADLWRLCAPLGFNLEGAWHSNGYIQH